MSQRLGLDLALELLYAPLYQRWLLRTGPLTPDYADALVEALPRGHAADIVQWLMNGEVADTAAAGWEDLGMYVLEAGNVHAPSLVLLHGGGVAGWMWRPTLERLGTTARVIIPDLPGHGRSAGEPYRSHEETVRAVARVLEERAPQGAMVAGFSLGAQLAILLAATRPDLVTAAVIVSAQAKPLRFPHATLGLLAATAPLARQRWFARLQAKELFIPEELLTDYLRDSARLSRATLLAGVGENIRFTLPAGWADFRNPALVLVGERERKLMQDSARAIHGSLPGSRLISVPECGHGIPLQRPDLFARILADSR